MQVFHKLSAVLDICNESMLHTWRRQMLAPERLTKQHPKAAPEGSYSKNYGRASRIIQLLLACRIN